MKTPPPPRYATGGGQPWKMVRETSGLSTDFSRHFDEPEHQAVPLLLDVVLERDLIGTAIDSLIWHVRPVRR